MKFCTALLTLCVVSPTSAFFIRAPKEALIRGPVVDPSTTSSLASLNGGQGEKSVVPGQGIGMANPAGGAISTAPAGVNGSVMTSPDVPGGRYGGMAEKDGSGMAPALNNKDLWDSTNHITVQGGSLRTWAFATPMVERVQVMLKTEGRPLNANVDLWQGPDNTPQKMGVYIEDGNMRPFCAVIATPRSNNAIAIRNTGQMEFPMQACVEAEAGPEASLAAITASLKELSPPEVIQGGALKTYSFAPSVASVQVLLESDGRPLNSRVELLQGPNNNKQIIELYTEDGMERPFFAVIETPGVGNVVRVLNTAPMEFPLMARVEPYLVESGNEDGMMSQGGWDTRIF